ncbi:MAG: 2-C-methyl-D-erythritol 4-phosphate cytidylyltransferase [Acidimicrobiia bacterium]|nr:2-C-methyl-D-erythritol 4-phosphate cytidylyltransferase [Acidimicrobiia bacterium]
MSSPEVWTIVVAGGSGSRFGRAKQFEVLGGRSVLARSVERAAAVSAGVVVVLAEGQRLPPDITPGSVAQLAAGGATRSESVRSGLRLVPGDAAIVVVHDAARPLASGELFDAVIAAVRAGADAAVPAVALTDTIRRVGGGTLDRSELVAVQTPQAFRADRLREVHSGSAEATDDATLVERNGGSVVLVDGETTNLKLTHAVDLALAEVLATSAPAGETTFPMPEAPPPMPETTSNQVASNPLAAASPSEDGPRGAALAGLRVGHGYDIHRSSDDPARTLVLGGVTFPGERGLEGHSDADAIAHAVTDALLGAAGLGDIGQHFPDTDPRYAGADSRLLLAEAVAAVRAAGWDPLNVDCTVVAERPKLAPRRAEIQQVLTGIVGAPVTVKGKRAERLGALGRSEGIACSAVALLVRPAPR